MVEKVFIRNDIFTRGENGMTLLAHKCRSCGKVYFPKMRFCANCFSDELEEIPLSRKGKLYTYTINHMSSSHFEPPYANGLVDTAEGARIFAPLAMVKDKPFKIGMDMELEIVPLWREGEKEIIGYKFSPV